MTPDTETKIAVAVPPEEIERRIAEHRRQGFERQAIPHVIYHAAHILCPWPGCGHSIVGIDFQLEKMADPALYSRLSAAWWQDPGLAGRCPGCGNHILFTMTDKRCVTDPAAQGLAILPDDWHQHAYVI